MGYFGLDLGGNYIKICCWNNDRSSSVGIGPEIVDNDRTQRMSLARVSFKGTSYNICSQRSETVAGNLSNNIWGMKAVIGSNNHFLPLICDKVDGSRQDRATYSVQYNKQRIILDCEVAVSLLLQYCYYRCLQDHKVDYDTFPMELPRLLKDPHNMVISIPSYYTTSNVRGLEVALKLRDMGEAAFIRENVAVALDYGHYKAMQKEFPEGGSTVLFCDMGAYSTTVTVVVFTNNGMDILGSRFMMEGGTRIDAMVADLLFEKCKEQFGSSIERDSRLDYKLQTAAEKVKKDLSPQGVRDVRFTVPNVEDDEDAEGMVSVEDFEDACRRNDNFFEKFYQFVIDSIQSICGDHAVDSVETVGGSMRLPQLRDMLLKAVQHCNLSIDKLSTTLNMEESCSRGCALFSHLYWEEKSVVCGEDIVVVKDGEKEVSSMPVCCCSPVKTEDTTKYVIQCHEHLEEAGVDHDWHTILEEGTKFMKMFVKTTNDLYHSQQKRNSLEKHYCELRDFIERSLVEKPELQEVAEKDQVFLESVNSVIRTGTIHHETVYDSKIKEVDSRLHFYKTHMSVCSKRLRMGDVEFVGVWTNGKMTGSFECYDLNGVHLYTAVFKDGVLNGKMVSYFENKTVKSIQHYSEGKLEGSYVGYHENGQLAEKCVFKDDKKEGYWQVYYDNGQIAKEGVIHDGKNVFVNLFHRNGVIAYQHLYTDKGKIHMSYEFNRSGEMVYCGKMVNGKYTGKSLVFYRNEYYAKCLFEQDLICLDGEVYGKRLVSWPVLDKQMVENGELDTSVIVWKPIRRESNDLPQCREVTLRYLGKEHVISVTEYHTKFDLLKKETDGTVSIEENGKVHMLSADEMRKRAMYDSDIQESVSKYYTLFGDLKSIVEFSASPVKTVKCTQFYPTGRNEVILNSVQDCRKRAEGELKDRKACGHWIEYYNNGKIRFEGEKEDGIWKEKKSFLNTGALLMD